jgi:hydroxyacylglutathione hydrolase
MLQVKSFVFSPLYENTYVLYDETQEAVVVDPGCLTQSEKEELKTFIDEQKLLVKAVLLTHAHLDHVFGVAYVKRIFGVKAHMHRLEIPILAEVENRCKQWGIAGYEPTEADSFFGEGDTFSFGNTILDIIHVPGHAPGHVAFIAKKSNIIMGGDCLFHRSIGRTDFPGCSHADLLHSIRTKFFTLPDNYVVYAGHMQPTTIGEEKLHNPFLK